MKKAAVLFSGGKDSCLALFKAAQEGYKIVCLLSVVPEIQDSMLFHTPNKELLEKQAEALSIPLITKGTKAREETEELRDLRELIKNAREKYKFGTLVVGGIASNYQAGKFGEISKNFGLEIYAPLWNYSSEKLWGELFKNKFRVVIIKASCEGISKEILGKPITKKEIMKLEKISEKYKFNLNFEGGEAETAVLWMPGFGKEIKIEYDVYSEGKYRHFVKIKNIK